MKLNDFSIAQRKLFSTNSKTGSGATISFNNSENKTISERARATAGTCLHRQSFHAFIQIWLFSILHLDFLKTKLLQPSIYYTASIICNDKTWRKLIIPFKILTEKCAYLPYEMQSINNGTDSTQGIWAGFSSQVKSKSQNKSVFFFPEMSI